MHYIVQLYTRRYSLILPVVCSIRWDIFNGHQRF